MSLEGREGLQEQFNCSTIVTQETKKIKDNGKWERWEKGRWCSASASPTKSFNLFSFFKVENIIYIPIYRYCCKQRHLYIYISITYIVIMEGESLFGGGGGENKALWARGGPSRQWFMVLLWSPSARLFTPDRKALRNLQRGDRRIRIKRRFMTQRNRRRHLS